LRFVLRIVQSDGQSESSESEQLLATV